MDKLTPYQKRLQTQMIVALITIVCCAGMIIIAEYAHNARKKQTVNANFYPTINNHNYKP
jgi:glutamine amidotransferase PdxT